MRDMRGLHERDDQLNLTVSGVLLYNLAGFEYTRHALAIRLRPHAATRAGWHSSTPETAAPIIGSHERGLPYPDRSLQWYHRLGSSSGGVGGEPASQRS